MKVRKFLFVFSLAVLYAFSACRDDNDQPSPQTPEPSDPGVVVTPPTTEPTDCSDELVLEKTGLELAVAGQGFTLPQNVFITLKIQEVINGDTVGLPDLTKDDFTIFENAKAINPLESEVKITPLPGEFNIYTVLLLDLSGSIFMNPSSLQTLKDAAQLFLSQVIRESNGNPQAAIYYFDGMADIHELIDFTSDTAALASAINSINADLPQDRSTNLHGGIEQGALIVKDLAGIDEKGVVSISQLVVFTDGDDEASWRTEQDAADAINTTMGKEVSVFTIGLGELIDPDKLELFGRDGFEFADDFDALIQSFNNIASRICSNVNSFYFFEYCSPKRNGEHTLKLEIAKSNSQQASVTYCFDATGFTDNCDLGQ
ncbi:MAG: VWA domain-containing protein [Bacteroidota bacterium]